MSIMDDYVASLNAGDQALLMPMYRTVKQLIPDSDGAIKYGMPTFMYKHKALLAIIANKKFASVYPYCSLESLGLTFQGFETTTGSIHFTAQQPLTTEQLKKIIMVRKRQIDALS